MGELSINSGYDELGTFGQNNIVEMAPVDPTPDPVVTPPVIPPEDQPVVQDDQISVDTPVISEDETIEPDGTNDDPSNPTT